MKTAQTQPFWLKAVVVRTSMEALVYFPFSYSYLASSSSFGTSSKQGLLWTSWLLSCGSRDKLRSEYLKQVLDDSHQQAKLVYMAGANIIWPKSRGEDWVAEIEKEAIRGVVRTQEDEEYFNDLAIRHRRIDWQAIKEAMSQRRTSTTTYADERKARNQGDDPIFHLEQDVTAVMSVQLALLDLWFVCFLLSCVAVVVLLFLGFWCKSAIAGGNMDGNPIAKIGTVEE